MLTLRKIEPADLPLLYVWENDSASWADGSNHNPLSRQDLRNYLEQTTGDIYRDGQLRLVIDVTDSDGTLPVGCIDLFDFEPRNLRAGIGIYVAPHYRRQGYGAEAMKRLMDYAFAFLHFRLVYAFVSTDNTASERLFDRLGFQSSSVLPAWTREHDARLWLKNNENPFSND